MSSSPSFPDFSELTFAVEGGNSAAVLSVHWPKTAPSGVTLGAGYDMGNRSKADVKADLIAAGVPAADAEKLSAGAGKKGSDAEDWVDDNVKTLPKITKAVAQSLYTKIYPTYVTKARNIVADWGGDWNKYPTKMKEVLVDLGYRGDLVKSHARLLDSVKKNDYAAFCALIHDLDYWQDNTNLSKQKPKGPNGTFTEGQRGGYNWRILDRSDFLKKAGGEEVVPDKQNPRQPSGTGAFTLASMNAEQLYDHLREVWKRAQKRFGNEGKTEFDFQDAEGRMNLLAARGFEIDTMRPVPSTNTKYDDCMFLVYKLDGKKCVAKFQCTTEWTAAGASAIILLGQHKYKLGIHHKSSPYRSLSGVKAYADIKGKGYRALNPDPTVRCTRITDASQVGTVGDNAASTHDNASINIHYGGEKTTVAADRAGAWSEGCQVLSGMENYLRFIKLIESDSSLKNTSTNELAPAAGKDGSRSLVYTLVDGDFLTPQRAAIVFPVDLQGGRAVSPESAAAMYVHTEMMGHGGYFPLGANTVWHGGIHLHVPEGHSVTAPFKGKVIAARLPGDPKKAISHYGSTNFILLQHDIDGATLNRTAPRGKLVGYRVTKDLQLRAKPAAAAAVVGTLHEGDRVDLTNQAHVTKDGQTWAGVVVARSSDKALAGKMGYIAVKSDWLQSYFEAPKFKKLDDAKTYRFYSLYMHLAPVRLDGKSDLFRSVKWLMARPAKPEAPVTETLSASVGAGGVNRPEDVKKVQRRLLVHGKYSGPVQDACDAATKTAITNFQATFLKKPDGRIDPGGGTWSRLCQPKPVEVTAPSLEYSIVKELDKGEVVKIDRDVEAGEVLWAGGRQGSIGSSTGLLHWEIFSEECLLPWAKQVIDDDDDFNMDCEAILKMVDQDDVSWSFFDENEVLSIDELHRFYKTNPKSRLLRDYACRFISEWAVNLGAAIPKLKGRFSTWGLEERLAPSLFWADAVKKKVPLPPSSKVWHYNPITFTYRVASANGAVVTTPPPETTTNPTSNQTPPTSTGTNTGPKKYDGTVTDGKLSPNFTLMQMTRSETATKEGINNTPSATEIANLKALCENVLEKVKDHFQASVVISSGFRNAKVNAAVGGSKTSQHMTGQAADFTVTGKTLEEVFNWIAFESNLEFDQVLYEFGRWIHVSYTTGKNRKDRRQFYKEDGKTKNRTITKPMTKK